VRQTTRPGIPRRTRRTTASADARHGVKIKKSSTSRMTSDGCAGGAPRRCTQVQIALCYRASSRTRHCPRLGACSEDSTTASFRSLPEHARLRQCPHLQLRASCWLRRPSCCLCCERADVPGRRAAAIAALGAAPGAGRQERPDVGVLEVCQVQVAQQCRQSGALRGSQQSGR